MGPGFLRPFGGGKSSSGPPPPPGRWSFPPTFRAIDSLRPTDRRRSARRRPQRHPGNFPPLGLGRGVEGSRFRGGAQRPLGTAREQSPNAGAEKRRQNTLPALRLSKKWLAPLFRGFHSSLAPTARPGSYAGKPLLRKAFCGFAVHAAKSDESLKGLRSSIRQRFLDKLSAGRIPCRR